MAYVLGDRPATEKQLALVRKLVGERYPESAGPEFLHAHEEEGTFADMRATSALIDALLKSPAPRGAKGDAPVADYTPEPGYYAVEYADVLRFYAVKAGKGRWEGRTFLNRYRSDYQDRVYRAEQEAVFEVIAADPAAAQKRFAVETTHCYVCGRRLTDAVSRDLGVGPDCRSRRA